jgi:ABC-type lipoprotein export system ATPase subunit
VGFVAQDTPTYAGLSIAKHLRLGAWLNPIWDGDLAKLRIEQLGLDPRQKTGSLSGGQRAQVALTLAIAKRPELPFASEIRSRQPANRPIGHMRRRPMLASVAARRHPACPARS